MGTKIKLVVSSLCIFQWVATLFGMACSSTTPMVRDLDRSPEIVVLSCPETPLSDFNASHFNNRLLLHPGDSKGDVAAAPAVYLSLKRVWRTELFLTDSAFNLKNLEVQASTEPQASMEADSKMGTGERAQVTVISFTTSKSVTFYQSSNFFRISLDNSSRKNTISTIDHAFRWREMSNNPFWIRTNANVNGLTSTSSSMFDSKQPVLGRGSCVRVSAQLENFSDRSRRNFQQQNPAIDNPQLNVFGLYGCDIAAISGYQNGLHKISNSMRKASNSTSWDNLGSLVWPRDSASFPRGWCTRRKVRVEVPVKYEYGEFVTVKIKDATGYGIDKIMANLEEMQSANVSEFTSLGKPIKEMAATYNGLVYRFYLMANFGTVIGDATVENCTLMFIKSNPTEDKWYYLEVKHWLVSIYFFAFIGSVVWILVKLVIDDFGSQTRQARTSL